MYSMGSARDRAGLLFALQRGTNAALDPKGTIPQKKRGIFKKAALTLTFLCVKLYNCTSIGKLRDFDLFELCFLEKEQKKYNSKSRKIRPVHAARVKG